MNFLAPSGLWFLLGIPVILVLYLIQSRYRPQVVASLMLWRHLTRDLEADAAWRRPRWDLLLALQLLIALLVALVLARPAMDVGSGQHLVVVMDTSSSMRARDVSPSRFEAAQNIAADAIREAGDGAKVTLVKAGQRPQVIVDAATPAVATSAVQSLTPETESGDMATAVRVAAGAAQSQVGWAGRVVAVTDGAFTLDVSPQAVPVTFKLVGGTAENMALSEVTLRRLIERGDSLAGFARVVNFGSTARSPTMTIVADAVAVDRRTVQVPASGHIDATFRVPSSAQSVSVVLSDRDAMSGDDRVDVAGYARTAPSITIVSDEPEIWQRVLAVVPDVKTRTVSPREFRASDALDGGIVLLDGVCADAAAARLADRRQPTRSLGPAGSNGSVAARSTRE
jgi:Ca-activated chloride channel homolog